jgi:hypothetical protein
VPVSAHQVHGHEANQYEHCCITNCGWQAKDLRRNAEKGYGDTPTESCERRVCDVSPLKVSRIIQKLELITVKPISVPNTKMNNQNKSRASTQKKYVGTP